MRIAQSGEDEAATDCLLRAGEKVTDGQNGMVSLILAHPYLHELLTPLLEAHALRPKSGLPPLHWATKHSHIPLLQHLLTLPSICSQINTQTYGYSSSTALHFAAISSNEEIVALLLSSGANPNAQDLNRKTPLHRACEAKASTVVVSMLIGAGASVNARDTWGETPLHLSADFRHEAVVRTLLASGADASLSDMYGRTALGYAVSDRSLRILEFLVESRAAVEGPKLLSELNLRRKDAVVKVLLEAGALVGVGAGGALEEAVRLKEFGLYGLLLVKGGVEVGAAGCRFSGTRAQGKMNMPLPVLSNYMNIY
ncbi:ankyrin repeat-containing domain protein [Tuber brumale]|nr:ankyrin repeat-containing domain protein [Tuber brumale]